MSRLVRYLRDAHLGEGREDAVDAGLVAPAHRPVELRDGVIQMQRHPRLLVCCKAKPQAVQDSARRCFEFGDVLRALRPS